jgi:hypothetical protein
MNMRKRAWRSGPSSATGDDSSRPNNSAKLAAEMPDESLQTGFASNSPRL